MVWTLRETRMFPLAMGTELEVNTELLKSHYVMKLQPDSSKAGFPLIRKRKSWMSGSNSSLRL